MRTNCLHCDCPLMCLTGEKRSLCVRCLALKWKRARTKQAAKKAPKLERTCKDCRKPFPIPEGSLIRQCGPCKKAKMNSKRKKYYAAHKEQISQRDKQRYHSDPSIPRQRAKQYYEAHREQVLAKKRERLKADAVSTTKLGMMR